MSPRVGVAVVALLVVAGLAVLSTCRGPRVPSEEDYRPNQLTPEWNRMLLLRTAAEEGNLAGIERSLDVGVPVDARYVDDSTALMAAARQGVVPSVELLIERGADLEARDHEDKTALYHAVVSGRSRVVSSLLVAGAEVDSSGDRTTPLNEARRRGHEEIVSLLERAAMDRQSR